MKNLDVGQRVLRHAARALEACADGLGQPFVDAVSAILDVSGRVVTCGVGKSGHIAQKTAATLSSTGTPSFFLHAAEAVHGDLGMVTAQDLVIVYSNSGETDEIVRLFPPLRVQGVRTLLITSRPHSTSAKAATWVLDTRATEEACTHDLAPTTSTTTMLALSDALAIAVMDRRGFGKEDFARYHPMGSLGRRLLLTVADVMRTGDDLAAVLPTTPYLEVSRAITRAGAGAACVLDAEGCLMGLVTDGDLRRHLQKSGGDLSEVAANLMTVGVLTISPDVLATQAVEIFQNHPRSIGDIPVVDRDARVIGMLMLKDLLRCGIM